MPRTVIIFGRALAGLLANPLTYGMLIGFPVLAGILTFYVDGFFERAEPDARLFFAPHPWLYAALIPALSAERGTGHGGRRPIRPGEALLGKFLAAWCLAGLALGLTFPFWLSVNLLGEPDNGAVFAGYLGSWLTAGAMLAIGAAVSAASGNRGIAYIATTGLLLALTAAGTPGALGLLRGWAPEWLAGAAAAGATGHLAEMARGVVDLRDVVYFLSLTAAFLGIGAILLDLKKAE